MDHIKSYDDKTLLKLQENLFEILVVVDEICEKNKIAYFLVGGTLLGAIRHKGFIPWDDDVDIAMPRNDYIKFIKICKNSLPNQYYLHNIETDKRYCLPFIKVRKKGTVFDERVYHGTGNHNEIFLDIFPLDDVRREGSINQIIRTKVAKFLYSALQSRLCTRYFKEIESPQKYFLRKIKIIMISPFSNSKLLKWQEKLMSLENNRNGLYYTNIGSSYDYRNETIKKTYVNPPIKVEFCGRNFNAPCDSNYILNRIYGSDYMELPPIEKRVTHSPLRIEIGE